MRGKRKPPVEESAAGSAAEESDLPPARKKHRASGHPDDAVTLDDEMEESVKDDPENANGNGDDDDESSEEEEKDYVEEENEEGQMIKRYKRKVIQIERGKDGYVAGSIVRVKLDNFVTYDHVEFRPGSHLNMIIGPNGTGKSTIVCAITLGLGWPPKILGRAPDISAFVKQGCKKAFTEIELKGRAGKRNVIIKREFNRDDKKSIWYMNGERTTGQKVSDTVADLGIQIGNLCAFLPQDKVAEFAQMNPKELLRATMGAAGDPNLTRWHDILVNNAGKLQTFLEELQTQQGRQQDLARRIEALDEDVENYRLRENLQRKIEEEECMKLVRDFRIKTNERTKLKKAWKRYQKRYQDHVNKATPCMKVRAREGKTKHTLQGRYEKLKTAHKKATDAIANLDARLENKACLLIMSTSSILFLQLQKATETEAITDELANLRNKEQERKNKIAECKTRIDRTKVLLENRPESVDTSEIDKQITDVRHEKRKLQDNRKSVERKIHACNEKGTQINNNLDQIQNQLGNIQDIRNKRIQALSRANPSCGYAMDWISKNRERFKQDIIFPAAVSVQVSDPSFAHLVELACGHNLQTFVAQNEDDYRILNQLNDQQHYVGGGGGRGQRVRINTISITPEDIQAATPYPVPREQLMQTGMEGYALDFCDCPPAMRAFLRNSAALHTVAISRETGDQIDEKAAQNCGVQRILYAGEQYRNNAAAWDDLRAPHQIEVQNIRTSRYGSRAKQITSNQTRFEARYFNQIVDEEEVERLNQQRAKLAEQRQHLENEIQSLSQAAKSDRPEQERLNKLEDELNARKKVIQGEVRRYEQAKLELQTLTHKYRTLKNQRSVDDQRAELKTTLMIHVKERIKLAKTLMSVCAQANKALAEASELQFEMMQADANIDAIDEHVRGFAGQQEELEAAVERSKHEYHSFKAVAQAAAEAAQNKVDSLDDETRDAMSAKWETDLRSVEEINQEIEQAKNDMELLPEVNKSAVDRRNRYKNELAVVESSVKRHKMRVDKLGMVVQQTHDKFDGALTDLVTVVSEKFGAALQRNDCAGEVRLVRTGEDYANWSLEILVKFRDDEDLQVLTGQRQSGGERSLTTIMYLTSLTELARTPFSLVDEINQGMDQRAERIVHDQMVEVTCKHDAGQYFLITPKLLTNLRYDRAMTVLCIYNGEYLPEDEFKLGDVKNVFANIRAKREQA
ncbi:hypothetical protein QFC21_003824 [Naganishia friedmannii]|uniref:Uncharacterized protein n=1 Tax=Naganishia friedmannii TaxID=89922 RepID=A0ACC2VLE9_9TREE|nr:hypothetical protein QFC21_003824 [Naganishia friedmannii]